MLLIFQKMSNMSLYFPGARKMKRKISRTTHVAWRIIDGKAYIVNTRNSTMHELDETATFIWKALDRHRTAEHLTEQLRQTYEVSHAQAQKDVSEFLDDLKTKGLIETA